VPLSLPHQRGTPARSEPPRRSVRSPGVTDEAIGSGYRLVRRIGRGAMGTVWEADGPTGRVAVKVLRPDLADDPEVVDRFLREREVLTRLPRSPHIVAVRDLVAEGDRLAIVMELVDGEQLRTLLTRDGTLAPRRALAIVAQLLDGLAVAHARGVVHRDIKPENVIVDDTDGDRVAIVDFGVAWITEHAALRTTGIVGTPTYMAPEVAAGASPDGRADVYSAGIVLFELLFGSPPFRGATVAEVLRARRKGVVRRPAQVSDDLWAALTAMLDAGPEARPVARDAAQELHRLLAGPLSDAPFAPLERTDDSAVTVRNGAAPAGSGSRWRTLTRPFPIALGLLVVVGAAVAIFATGSGSEATSGACVRGNPVGAPRPPYSDDVIIDATDQQGADHSGKFFAGVWLGFGNSGVAGPGELAAMRRAGVVPESLPTVTVPYDEYRRLPNRPRDGALFREWAPRGRRARVVYFVAVGGTVAATDASGVRAIGRDPARAVAVPRYAFDRLSQSPPVDGALLMLGDHSAVIRSGRSVDGEPCRGSRPVRLPTSARLASGIDLSR